jgi:putative phage-type endonuclease
MTSNILKKHDTKIREVIKQDYVGYYEYESLTEVIANIANEVTKEYDTLEHNELYSNIVHFIYYSKDKYSFSCKRKHFSKKGYHKKILGEVLIKEKDLEPTSEELEMLEKEIFQKINKGKKNKNKKIEVELSEESSSAENSNSSDSDSDQDMYAYPVEKPFKKINSEQEPVGSQWVHDVQVDDHWTKKEKRLNKQFDFLRAIKLPEQRSDAWFEMRSKKITASDGGTVLNVNHHEPQYKFILKKTVGIPFISNVYVYHGRKLEEIAILVYEYRLNVKCDDFGLIGHPTYSFLGASPDSISTKYKLDGKHKTNLIGRMLEIKCPYTRKIKMSGPIIDHICPIYYWVQVQLQLECCDLDECDFWQCEIREYDSREEFIEDTNLEEPFRSEETGFEKGCLIQLLPKSEMANILDGKYDKVVWDTSKFIYPPKIEMTPHDCDLWTNKTIIDISMNYDYEDYFFDKVIYWKMVKSKNVIIHRDRKWFAEKLPEFKRMWNYVLFFRKYPDKLDIFIKYIESCNRKVNKDIMNVVEKLYNMNEPNYEDTVQDIMDNTEINIMKKKMDKKEEEEADGYMFVSSSKKSSKFKKPILDEDDYMFVSSSKNKSSKKKPIISKYSDDDDYMFAPTSKKKKTSTKKTKKRVKPTISSDEEDYPFL